MNEYWNQRMMTARKQDIVLTKPWMSLYGIGTRITPFQMERIGANLGDPADPLGSSAWGRLSSGSYGTVYSRTATAMRQIESLVGTPAMERAMKLYYERWKFRHPATADLHAALSEGTGRPDVVNAAFDAFIYGTVKVNDRVASISSEEELPLPGYRMHKGQQVLVGSKALDKAIADRRAAWDKQHPDAKDWQGPFPYRSTVVVRREGLAMPQTLRVTFADGTHRDMAVTTTGSWQRFSFLGPAKVVSAQLDPENRIHMDLSELDDSRTVEPDKQASRRWFRDFSMLLQSLFALLATI
jgi:hypothetical protein